MNITCQWFVEDGFAVTLKTPNACRNCEPMELLRTRRYVRATCKHTGTKFIYTVEQFDKMLRKRNELENAGRVPGTVGPDHRNNP